jgi:hypothetical protein
MKFLKQSRSLVKTLKWSILSKINRETNQYRPFLILLTYTQEILTKASSFRLSNLILSFEKFALKIINSSATFLVKHTV